MISEIQTLLDALNGIREIGYKVEPDVYSNFIELNVFDDEDMLIGSVVFIDNGWKYEEWEL